LSRSPKTGQHERAQQPGLQSQAIQQIFLHNNKSAKMLLVGISQAGKAPQRNFTMGIFEEKPVGRIPTEARQSEPIRPQQYSKLRPATAQPSPPPMRFMRTTELAAAVLRMAIDC